jgi:hypothetical protein
MTSPFFPETHKLEAEASFVADDPWNANRQAAFSLDSYVYTVVGTKVRPNSRPAGIYRHGIRSELGGGAHDLPDSLYFAWRAGRIKAEALPRLLHELQPTLTDGKWGDYGVDISNRAFTIVFWIAAVWAALAFAGWIGFWALEYSRSVASLPFAIVFGAIFPLLGGGVFYRGIYQVWRRRMAQTKWILARARA